MTDEGYDAKVARLRERIAKLKKNPANARAIADLEDELKLLEHDAKKTDGQKLMDAVSTLRGRVEVAATSKNDADPPFATNIKEDWRAEKIGKAWYAIGTALGEHMNVKSKSESDAKSYANRMNARAREAIEGNKRWAEERKQQAKTLRAKRAAERGRQGNLF